MKTMLLKRPLSEVFEAIDRSNLVGRVVQTYRETASVPQTAARLHMPKNFVRRILIGNTALDDPQLNGLAGYCTCEACDMESIEDLAKEFSLSERAIKQSIPYLDNYYARTNELEKYLTAEERDWLEHWDTWSRIQPPSTMVPERWDPNRRPPAALPEPTNALFRMDLTLLRNDWTEEPCGVVPVEPDEQRLREMKEELRVLAAWGKSREPHYHIKRTISLPPEMPLCLLHYAIQLAH